MTKRQITTYDQAVDYIMNIPRFTTKNTMEDTRGFLHRLGDPDEGLHILHVAGTNGKGSVCAYMRSVLAAAGRRVAVFTSPHLVDIRERFCIDGNIISREAFLEAFCEVYEKLDWQALENGEGYHPTFFEYLFFMAMLLFAKACPDYCILETGLGGRLDATNAVAHKEIAVITHISLDHVEYLGHTLGAIAGEKAGIIRAGTPVIYADTCQEVEQVIRERAHLLSATAYPVSRIDYSFLKNNNKNIDFSYISRYYGSVSLEISTFARYQMENCSLAMRALEVLAERERTSGVGAPLQLTSSIMQRGVSACFWPARMEEVLPGVYVDGAHNVDGMRAFLESVAADGHQGSRHLLFGAVRDKDYSGMMRLIITSGLFNRLSIVQLNSARGVSLDSLWRELSSYPNITAAQYPSASEALRDILTAAETEAVPERIYIAGSLYLAGEVKALLQHRE
ncbi:MAG: Mur ligase family protein [bacterium]|nr:Mur ligase family protein [bacterium]MCM1375425.1 Mur ligase family protein [Muribaculum sp.]